MNLPIDLLDLINKAKNEIIMSKHGLLSREIRYKIIRSFGEIKKVKGNFGEAITTIGRKRSTAEASK
jgi:hypothetical protein